MKIDRIRTFIVDSGLWKNWVFVRVDTDEGLHGWGEAFTEAGREVAIAAEAEAFGARLIGQDPLLIRRHVAELQVNAASRRRSLEFCSALSGIEIALWDLAGKFMGQPIHALLGGRHRDRIRVYSNCHDGRVSTPDEWGALCSRMVASGFAAVKIYPVWRPIVTRRDEDEAVAVVAAVRHAVGPDIDVMLDLARNLTPVQAVRIAERVEEYRPFWFEEPVPSDNLVALAEVRARTRLPILTGESLFTKTEFRGVFEARAADYINPDVCNCGGILELTEIAAWAEPNFVMVTPHNWNSLAIGLAATLQAGATIANLLNVEHITTWAERSNELLTTPFEVVDSTIAVPMGPGLGVDLDLQALARYPMRAYGGTWPD